MLVTSKGQVTIPQEIRERNGITTGTDVEFYEDSSGIHLRVNRESSRGEDLIRHMTGRGNGRMTTDEIMAMTRGED